MITDPDLQLIVNSILAEFNQILLHPGNDAKYRGIPLQSVIREMVAEAVTLAAYKNLNPDNVK